MDTPAETVTAIKDVAEQVTSEIIKAHDNKPNDKRPLFVLLGESHQVAAHIIMQILTVRNLQQKKYKLACGIELPHNRLSERFYKYAKYKEVTHPPSLPPQDAQSVLDLQKHLAFPERLDAPQTKKVLFRFLLSQQIAARFNDAATYDSNKGFCLDPDDPLTRKFIDDTPGASADCPMRTLNHKAVFIRNRLMQDRAEKHAIDTGCDIYIQFAGNAHLAGNADRSPIDPFNESLTALFRQSGHSVLAIPIFNGWWTDKNMLPNARQSSNILQSITLDGLGFSGSMGEYIGVNDEGDWLRNIQQHLPLQRILFRNGEEVDARGEAEIKAYFDSVLAAHEQHQAPHEEPPLATGMMNTIRCTLKNLIPYRYQ